MIMNDPKIPTHGTASELINTHAERLAHEEYERAQKRRLELADQRSDLNPPEVRIRTWERVHALRMPGDPSHPILEVIAAGTGLTLAQIRDEQRARVAQRTPMPKPKVDDIT
jgi:hypothetical protein